MSRFPTDGQKDPSAQRMVEEELQALHGGDPPFKYKDSDGTLLGCYAPLPYNPHIVKSWFALAKEVYKSDTIKPRNRELAIFAVASVYDAPYILDCHYGLANRVGLSQEQAMAASQGIVPDGLTDVEATTYSTARKLAQARGPLDDESWQTALVVLGREQAAGVAHVVGSYLYVCTMLSISGKGEPEVA